MASPLFSTYRQGENRVTATILAVFERVSFAIVEQILQSLLQEPEASLVRFQNQPPGIRSVPDARIYASFSYWIETKTFPDAVRCDQLTRHLDILGDPRYGPSARQRLLVLTPDADMPSAIDAINDERIVWSSFEDLVVAIKEAIEVDEEWLSRDAPLPTQSEQEMLRELVQFLTSENLIGLHQDRVLIVAARRAYPQYQYTHLYFCQPNRSFRPSSHLGFYYDGHVQPVFPQILGAVESIFLDHETVSHAEELEAEERDRLLEVMEELDKKGVAPLGEETKVLFLSGPHSPETIKLPKPIPNDLTADSGRKVGFTQGHRYVTLAALEREPASTTKLIRLSDDV